MYCNNGNCIRYKIICEGSICSECGEKLIKVEQVLCPTCNKIIMNNHRYCAFCGSRMDTIDAILTRLIKGYSKISTLEERVKSLEKKIEIQNASIIEDNTNLHKVNCSKSTYMETCQYYNDDLNWCSFYGNHCKSQKLSETNKWYCEYCRKTYMNALYDNTCPHCYNRMKPI